MDNHSVDTPIQQSTYKTVVVESINTPVTEKPITMTFNLCKALHNKSLLPDIADNATVGHGIEFNTSIIDHVFNSRDIKENRR